jgi:hypothetical protein
MLRKNTTIVLIFLLQTVILVAQESRFKEGENIHVWASSGLNMRSKPDAKAEKLATIPYGAKVVVQPNIGVKIPFEVEEFKGFVVKGYWLLVKYDNTEGFVFDGFLSRLPAPISSIVIGDIDEYLDQKIEKVGSRYELKIWDSTIEKDRKLKANEKVDDDKISSFKQKYKQGIVYESTGGEVSGGYTIELPNITLYEGYFLIKTFSYFPDSDAINYNKQEKSIKINPKMKMQVVISV